MELVSDLTHLPTSPAPAPVPDPAPTSLTPPTVRYPQGEPSEAPPAAIARDPNPGPPNPGAAYEGLQDPKDGPIEPSTGEGPAGVPAGLLALLSPGEIAMFAALGLLVVAAVATAVFALGR
jgi:hypothetical protein